MENPTRHASALTVLPLALSPLSMEVRAKNNDTTEASNNTTISNLNQSILVSLNRERIRAVTEHSTPPARKKASRHHPLVRLLLTFVFCSLFVALGYWQLQRAAQAEAHQRILQERTHAGYLSVAQLTQLAQPDNFPLAASGHFDNAHSLLLDNRLLDGVAGYELITPFISNTGEVLLVNRGWLPRGATRSQLPAIPPVSGEVHVSGTTHLPTPNRFLPTATTSAPTHWPVRVAQIDPQLIGHWLKQPLLPVVLRLDADIHFAQPALPRHWQVSASFTPARHRAYAVQWFLFAAIALGIYLTLSWRRRRSSRPHETDA